MALDRPFSPDLARLSELAKVELDQLDLVQPSGDPTIKAKKDSYEYRWGDLKYLVEIHSTDNPLEVELTYRERNPLAQIMRVHRAEAGYPIKIFSVSMAISLLIILASGVVLALGLPKLRRNALFALSAGVLALLPIFL